MNLTPRSRLEASYNKISLRLEAGRKKESDHRSKFLTTPSPGLKV